jgi:hypothetical protein
MSKIRTRAIRNLKSAGWNAANSSARTADKAATGLLRWAVTDHSGMSDAMSHMPSMGFWDTILYALIHFVLTVLGALLTCVWIYLLLVYGLPFFITGHF